MKKLLIGLGVVLGLSTAQASTGSVEDLGGHTMTLVEILLEKSQIDGFEDVKKCVAQFKSYKLDAGIESVNVLRGAQEEEESETTYEIAGSTNGRDVVLIIEHGEGSLTCSVNVY